MNNYAVVYAIADAPDDIEITSVVLCDTLKQARDIALSMFIEGLPQPDYAESVEQSNKEKVKEFKEILKKRGSYNDYGNVISINKTL